VFFIFLRVTQSRRIVFRSWVTADISYILIIQEVLIDKCRNKFLENQEFGKDINNVLNLLMLSFFDWNEQKNMYGF